MKHIVCLIALLPGAAFAHGGHPPVPEVAHGLSHMAPAAGAAVVALAFLAGWFQRNRS